jgi:hypothetical protein
MPSFRESVEMGEGDGYEPQLLWLIPLTLRSRKQFYDEVVATIRNDIERGWKQFAHLYLDRAKYEASSYVDSLWRGHSPYWWGLDDVVAWIDARACVRSREIQLGLFLPSKRISRKLKEKRYVHQFRRVVAIPERTTNKKLQVAVISAIKSLKKEEKVKHLVLNTDQWFRVIRNTNLTGIIRSAYVADN